MNSSPQSSVTPVPGFLMASSNLCRHLLCMRACLKAKPILTFTNKITSLKHGPEYLNGVEMEVKLRDKKKWTFWREISEWIFLLLQIPCPHWSHFNCVNWIWGVSWPGSHFPCTEFFLGKHNRNTFSTLLLLLLFPMVFLGFCHCVVWVQW